VCEALLRTAHIASDDLAFLDKEIAQLWGEVAQEQENTIILNKVRFLGLPSALKRHLLRVSIEKLLGNLKDIETRHIEEIMGALTKPAGKRLNLPGGLIFSIEYDKYLIGADPAALSPFPSLGGEFQLKIPGETLLPGWRIEANILSQEDFTTASFIKGRFKGRSPFNNYSSPSPSKEREAEGVRLIDELFTAYFDLDKTGDRLTVRSRQTGDRFQPLGLSQPKKLGEFMIDAKIPHAWRQRIPIVCSPQHILWVVGWHIDERVKVTDNTKQILRLKFEQG
jgi:tRNA(Ile)-lysidine synthase